uniref:Uncharacterized protein n=1 Tax=Rhizophora mucronata TaxID=61149 RepID=A0A2P2NXE0_RHIMU
MFIHLDLLSIYVLQHVHIRAQVGGGRGKVREGERSSAGVP